MSEITLRYTGIPIYTPSADTAIVAGTGLTVTNGIMRIYGSGGPVTVTATPSIAPGIDGQVVYIQGTSDTNLVTFRDSDNLANTGLSLAGNVDFTLGINDTLTLMYDASELKWIEISRSDNN